MIELLKKSERTLRTRDADRDIHAAKNVKLFGSIKRAECLEQASAETLASTALNLCLIPQVKSMKRKQKADSL